MSFVEKLRTELALQPGEIPGQYMRRYADAGVVAPGYTLERWVGKLVEASRTIGDPQWTPYGAEAYAQYNHSMKISLDATLRDVRHSTPAMQSELAVQNTLMQAQLVTMQLLLTKLRHAAPELVEGLPDIDPQQVGQRILKDMRDAVGVYDELNRQRLEARWATTPY